MAKLSPFGNEAQFINGIPAAGALLFTYAAGSSTKQTTYTDEAGSTPQANPIVLNARGEPASPIWLTEGLRYKFVLAPSDDTDPPASPIRTIDDVAGVNDASVSISQWVESGATPTYVNATQFTVPGDKTSDFTVNRRVKCATTGGTVYGYISVSAYTSLTTVTVVLDSGTLDSGLSSVELGLITPNNTSLPKIDDFVTTAMIASDAVETGKIANDAVETVKIKNSAVTKSKLGSDVRASASDVNTGTAEDVFLNPKTYRENGLVFQNPVSASGQTVMDFSSIPAWVEWVRVIFNELSSDGSSNYLVQLGDAGGVETTGYVSSSGQLATGGNVDSATTGFILRNFGAAAIMSGYMDFCRIPGTNTWIEGHALKTATNSTVGGGGSKTLSDTLTSVRVTTVNGTDTFDGSGSVSLFYFG